MRYCITIRGKVQGVFFRKFTQDKAMELGILGFVKNMPDGSVYCEAEGDEKKLQLFLDWCGIGSPQSHVAEVNVETKPASGFPDFRIVRD